MVEQAVYFKYIDKLLFEDLGFRISYSHSMYHKLLYFSLAHFLTENSIDDGFQNITFEAWENGPVIANARKEIMYINRGQVRKYTDSIGDKELENLTDKEKKSMEYIVNIMRGIPASQLSDLTHHDVFLNSGETPWKKVNNCEGYCSRNIDKKYIQDFYTKQWFESFEYNIEKIKQILGAKYD